jgi:Dienelactone hydrolase family
MDRKPIHILSETDFWKISMIDGDSDVVTISISSSPRVGQQFANEEFVGTASKHGKAIFLIDKTNSFGNRLDWDVLINTIGPHLVNKKVRAVGFCMGGFLAIVLSKLFNIDSVVAITPQYSAANEYLPPDDYPGDRFLWFRELYTDRITDFKIPSLDGYFQDRTQYYILNSSFNLDQWQIQYFPKQDNVHILQFGEKYGHELPGLLGENLHKFVEDCFNHDKTDIEEYIRLGL